MLDLSRQSPEISKYIIQFQLSLVNSRRGKFDIKISVILYRWNRSTKALLSPALK